MTDSKARFRFWIDMLSNLIEKKEAHYRVDAHM